MNVYTALLLPVIATCALAPAVCRAAPDADALIRRLARPPTAQLEFTEARFSPLLREPIIISGELEYGGPGNFDRRVVSPYAETVAVRGQSVRLERDGDDARTFRLRRAPELRALLTGFVALLTGDPAAVRASFTVEAGGDDDAWSLALTPLDGDVRQRLDEIVVFGSGAEPRCVATLNAQEGAGSVMLLGATAAHELQPELTFAGALALCSAE
jgi:hypothetical protein